MLFHFAAHFYRMRGCASSSVYIRARWAPPQLHFAAHFHRARGCASSSVYMRAREL